MAEAPEQESERAQKRLLQFRITDEQDEMFDAVARAHGFLSVQEWARVTLTREARRALGETTPEVVR